MSHETNPIHIIDFSKQGEKEVERLINTKETTSDMKVPFPCLLLKMCKQQSNSEWYTVSGRNESQVANLSHFMSFG